MWILILERIIYFRTEHGRRVAAERAVWEERTERSSWYARQIREAPWSRG